MERARWRHWGCRGAEDSGSGVSSWPAGRHFIALPTSPPWFEHVPVTLVRCIGRIAPTDRAEPQPSASTKAQNCACPSNSPMRQASSGSSRIPLDCPTEENRIPACYFLLCRAVGHPRPSGLASLWLKGPTQQTVWCPTKARSNLCRVPLRRLEDRIRKLCNQLVAAESDLPEFHALAAGLRSCLTEHIGRTRERLADYPASSDRHQSP